MSHSESSANDDRSEERQSRTESEETAAWFAASTVRMVLALVGFLILLFALGQAVGVNLLGIVADALTTRLGQWLVVAFVGILLIMLALRGFRTRAE